MKAAVLFASVNRHSDEKNGGSLTSDLHTCFHAAVLWRKEIFTFLSWDLRLSP